MASVDNRVVDMGFNNAAFESKIATTMGSLEKLKGHLNFDGAKAGIADLSAAGSVFNLQGMAAATEHIASKFDAMGAIAFSAISNITNKAMNMGIQLTKSFTIDPVKSGFGEYELKMGAIQTIMAGTGEKMETVNTKLKELNAYSDKTIYSFKDMTSNISKFTNAGVSLDESVAAIQGVANAAALSGANAEEAGRAMYNFGQALSTGSVKLMDWKSIENANMATVEFKTQLMESAVAAGTLTKGADGLYTSLEGTNVNAKNFNTTLEQQWLTSEALTDALGNYADETTDIGKRATAAATTVKSFTQMMDTLKESAGSGWAESSELLFGNLEEAKYLFTGLNSIIGGAIGASADARNKILGDFRLLGGRDVLVETLFNAFTALGNVLKPIKDAFREIFPRKTGQDLFDLSLKLRSFVQSLILAPESMEKVKRIFKGLFGIISIGVNIIKGVIGFFKDLVGIFLNIAGAGGGTLEFFAMLGDGLFGLSQLLKGNGISAFFDGIINVIQKAFNFISPIFEKLGKAFHFFSTIFLAGFEGFDLTGDLSTIDEFANKIGLAFGKIKDFIGSFSEIWGYFIAGFTDMGTNEGEGIFLFANRVGMVLNTLRVNLATVADYFMGGWNDMWTNEGEGINLFANKVGMALGSLKEKISSGLIDGFGDGITEAFTKVKDAILPGLQAILDSVLNFFGIKSPSTVFFDIGNNLIVGLGDGIKAAFTTLGNIFKDIFGFIGDLLEGVSFDQAMKVVDSGLLLGFLVVFKQLRDTFKGWGKIGESVKKAIDGVTGVLNGMQTKLKAEALLKIAIALAVLTASIVIISMIDAGALGKALGAMAIGFGELAIMMKILDKTATGPKDAVKIGLLAGGLILIAGAMFILAAACKIFALLDIDELAMGLGTVSLLLVVMSKTIEPISKNSDGMIKAGIGITAIAGAILLLGLGVKLFSMMDPVKMAQGLIAIGVLLAGLAISVEYFSKNSEGMIKAGLGILAIAFALDKMAGAVEKFGKMDTKVLVQGMIAVGVGLAFLTAAVRFLPKDMDKKGAGILLISAALYVLAMAVEKFGNMSWEELGKGLGAVAVLMGALVGAMWLMPDDKKMVSIGLGLLMFSVALVAIASVVKLLSTMSLEELLKGVGALAVIMVGLAGAMRLMPDGKELTVKGAGILVVAGALLLLVRAVKELGAMSISSLITGLVALAAIFVVIGVAGHFLTPVIPTLIAFGIAMVLIGGGMALVGVAALLLAKAFGILVKILIDNLSGMGEVFQFFVDNLTKLLVAIAKAIVEMAKIFIAALPEIIGSLDKTIVAILDLIIDSIPKIAEVFVTFVTTMIDVMIELTPKVVLAGVGLLIGLLEGIRDNIGKIVTVVAEIIVNFLDALTAKMPELVNSGMALLTAFLQGIADNIGQVVTAVVNIITSFINGLTANIGQIIEAGKNFVIKFLEGVVGVAADIIIALGKLIVQFVEAIATLATDIIAAGKDFIIKVIEGFAEAVTEIVTAIGTMVVQFIEAVGTQATRIMEAGTAFIVQIILGFSKAVGEILTAIKNFCLQFIEQVGVAATEVMAAGTALIVQLILGFAKAGAEILTAIKDLCVLWIEKLGEAVTDIIKAGAAFIVAVLKAASEATIEILNGAADIIEEFLKQLAITINDHADGFKAAGMSIFRAIISGIPGFGSTDLQSEANLIGQKIGKDIVAGAKYAIDAKSPSKVFMQIGDDIIEGLAIGIDNNSNAIDTMKKTLNKIPTIVEGLEDFNPTITPVLDLTNVQKEAGKLGTILGSGSGFTAQLSYSQAALLAAASRAHEDTTSAGTKVNGPTEIKFEQTINSPAALSTADIYRQTRNQISMAKEELAVL